MPFQDRAQAGELLARHLVERKVWRSDTLVLALPRGGVPVAAPVARALHAPLDVFLVRKLGLPGREEFAMGAIASGGVRVLNEEVIRDLRIPPAAIEASTARELLELKRRDRLYRGSRPYPRIANRTVVVVDDGLATGATMKAAVSALKLLSPARIEVAVPVAPQEACEELARIADEVHALVRPHPFHGVGLWYASFDQTGDGEVIRLLEDARLRNAA